MLKDYTLCMRPVAMALDILQGDEHSCQGYILPVLFGVKAGFADNITKKLYVSEYGRILHDTLVECFDKNENKNLILAASIHPKFKLSWLQRECDREYAQSLLINTCVDLTHLMGQHLQNMNDFDQPKEHAETDSNECDFFKHLNR